jgi:hypothetical protein
MTVSAGPGRIRKTTMSDAFEDLPTARKTPFAGTQHSNLWTADYTVGTGFGLTYATVKAIVDEDKASDLRLRREQRGNMMVGMLVDAAGVVYGASGTSLGGPVPSDVEEVPLSRLDVARARLIDLASSWRRLGMDHAGTPRSAAYAECARELDEAVVELLASSEDECPDD